MELVERKLDGKEIIELAGLRCKVAVKNALEYAKVVSRYYSNTTFAKTDLLLLKQYLTQNPFRLSRQQLQTMGEKDVYTYGETPLTTMESIAKTCGITAEDTVFELGAGRGRTCFWLRTVLGCSVVGIEWLGPFVTKAKHVVQKMELDRLEFRQDDFIASSLEGATVVYLYGTNLTTEQIQALCKNFESLPEGTRIITVSYSLTDYANGYEVLHRFSAPFTWGEADVYLQVKKKSP
jgi:hypothetical protein